MKILYSLLLIVAILVCVQFAHGYGALAVTLRWNNFLFQMNTADALIGSFGLENGSYSVYADINDDDPPDSGQGAFGNQNIFTFASDYGPLHASGVASCYVKGHDEWGNFQDDNDSDSN